MPTGINGLTLLAILVPCGLAAQTYTISTIAGGGFPSNIRATSAALRPKYVAADRSGNVYFTDELYPAVFRVDAATGVITAAVGNGTTGFSGDGGPATSASLNQPEGVAVDSSGNLYIADYTNLRVRKVSNGVITTVAGSGTANPQDGGAAIAAGIHPSTVAVDSAGNLYFYDDSHGQIFKVSGGALTTIAGSGIYGTSGDGGPATGAQLTSVDDITLDSAGNLYISCYTFEGFSGSYQTDRIRKVSNGLITTVAGGGTSPATNGQSATTAGIYSGGLATDASGALYFVDHATQRVLKLSGGILTYVAGGGIVYPGNGGAATDAALFAPQELASDSAGTLYVTERESGLVRKISNGAITTIAGGGSLSSGPANGPVLSIPTALAIDKAENVYIVDQDERIGSYGAVVQKVTGNTIAPVAGNGVLVPTNPAGDNVPATSASVGTEAVAVDSAGNLYIADENYSRIRKVSGGIITTVAGSGTSGFSGDGGPAGSAALNYPSGLAMDATGNLYIADNNNSRIRKISNGVITTVAGNGTRGYTGDGGPALSAHIAPQSVGVDPSGNNIYIVDINNGVLRQVSNGVITTIAKGVPTTYSGNGGPTIEGLTITGVAADSAGNVYIADSVNNRIRKLSNGIMTNIAGNGTAGFAGDGGSATTAELNAPQAVAVDANGKIYFADTGNLRIRVLTPAPVAIAGPSSEASGDVGVPYNGTPLTPSGGIPPYTWSALSLPPGLSLSANGVISGTPTTAGTFSPVFTVKDSLGKSASITLSIEIDAVQPVAGLQNAGSFASGAVAPGEIVVVWGSGIGPSNLTLAQVDSVSGLLQSNVGGTTIQFNGIAAPLVYSSAGQVAAIVRFELAGLTSAQIVVSYQGKGIAASTVQVVPAAPSIFTTGSGTGQAAALNQDSSVNSVSNPAAAGSTIVLYLTGCGQTNPGSVDGQIVTATPFPQPVLPVTVTIGGQPTTYAYAGAAPYEVAGVWQINAAIPAGVSGNAVPVSVRIGTAATQTGVTIAVR